MVLTATNLPTAWKPPSSDWGEGGEGGRGLGGEAAAWQAAMVVASLGVVPQLAAPPPFDEGDHALPRSRLPHCRCHAPRPRQAPAPRTARQTPAPRGNTRGEEDQSAATMQSFASLS